MQSQQRHGVPIALHLESHLPELVRDETRLTIIESSPRDSSRHLTAEFQETFCASGLSSNRKEPTDESERPNDANTQLLRARHQPGFRNRALWNANCGCLPVLSVEGKVSGVITDRDICVALGTRNQVAGEVTVAEVISGKLYCCAPEDEIHLVLQRFGEARVRRLPVDGRDGSLIGVISIDDILLRAENRGLGKEPELSTDEVIRTFRSIVQRRAPEIPATRTVAA